MEEWCNAQITDVLERITEYRDSISVLDTESEMTDDNDGFSKGAVPEHEHGVVANTMDEDSSRDREVEGDKFTVFERSCREAL